MIYLDSAATAPVCSAAAAAVAAAMAAVGNPSSRHAPGREKAGRLRQDRETVASALGCLPEELTFTSGGTEANNWAIRGALELGRRVGRHIITTEVEHSAVLEPLARLTQEGYEVTRLRPDRTGRVSPGAVAETLRPDTVLVSVMLVNNELGTRQPVGEIAAALRGAGSRALLHSDAVQGFLKVPFTPRELGVDLLTVSGHKIGAPAGVGALYIRQELKLPPLLLGGGQEDGRRPGTEPDALIAGFAAAARRGPWEAAVRPLREYAAARLAELDGVVLLGAGDAPHILSFSLPGYPGEVTVRVLSDAGVCISSGAACHRGRPSHVFAALGLPRPVRDGALRASFSPETTRADIDALADALAQCASTLVRKGY